MTILELYDIIVGYENEEDFNPDTVEHIRKLSSCVLRKIQKMLPDRSRVMDLQNEKSIQAMQVSEYLDIVEGRWRLGCDKVI